MVSYMHLEYFKEHILGSYALFFTVTSCSHPLAEQWSAQLSSVLAIPNQGDHYLQQQLFLAAPKFKPLHFGY